METPPFRVLTTLKIGSIIGVIQSAIWIVLCSLAMMSYYQCEFGDSLRYPSDLFGVLMHRYYFLGSHCTNFAEIEGDTQVLSSREVNTWVIIMLSLNVLWFFSSLVLGLYAFTGWTVYLFFVAYTWVFIGGAVAVVDITVGVLFGMTYGRIGYIIEEGSMMDDGIELALLQLVALCLMTIAFKGFIMLLINIATVVATLAIICDEYAFNRTNDQNVIMMDPIHAFGSTQGSRRFSRSTGERTSWRRRENNSDRIYTSGEWPPMPTPNDADVPFSYIDDPVWHNMHRANPQARNLPRRPVRRPDDHYENSPQLPEPDYSPIQHRRLKSALKPTA